MAWKKKMTHLIDVALPTSMHPETHTLAKKQSETRFRIPVRPRRMLKLHSADDNPRQRRKSVQTAGWLDSIYFSLLNKEHVFAPINIGVTCCRERDGLNENWGTERKRKADSGHAHTSVHHRFETATDSE